MNRIRIVLCGKEFSIQTDEGPTYVKQLADALNKKVNDFIMQNGEVSVSSACMLVSLGLMDDCIKAASDKDNLRKQVIDYLEEATRSRNEVTELKKQIEDLKQQNEMLTVKLMACDSQEQIDEQTHF